MGGIWGDMEPMERAGTLGPTWDPRAARSIGSISPISPPYPHTTYIYLYVYLWTFKHTIVCIYLMYLFINPPILQRSLRARCVA